MNDKNRVRWIGRTVIGIGLASFFSDLGHETASAILPMFLASIGAAPAALGIIEGVSDAVSSFVKLWAGWFSDRIAARKPMAVSGYVLTAIAKASFAFATSWWYILFGRTVAWIGRGIRGPVRDSILTDAVPAEARGRAFGFDRALDTLGAVLGPVAALWLVGFVSFRTIFLLTLIPGLFAAGVFGWIVRERKRAEVVRQPLRLSLAGFPALFRRYLLAVGFFGAGDFAPTLLIFYAANVFTSAGDSNPSQEAVSLYVCYNVVYALASYPVGSLGDRLGKRNLLLSGYLLSAGVCVGFALLPSTYAMFVLLFSLAGIAIAVQDSLERALAADLLPTRIRGTGYGALAGLNGIGDFLSSTIVGILWTAVSVREGFLFSAILKCAGGLLLLALVPRKPTTND